MAHFHLPLIHIAEFHILQICGIRQLPLSCSTILLLVTVSHGTHAYLIPPGILPSQIKQQGKPNDDADDEADDYSQEPALNRS